MVSISFAWMIGILFVGGRSQAHADYEQAVSVEMGVKIPMRDGVNLAATIFKPKDMQKPLPVISGDQHLGCVAQYGVDDWRDASVAFCVPSIVNYYPRQWLPLDPPARPVDGPLPNLGDYTEGFGNKLTIFTYAKPTAFPAPLTNLAASASGHGLVRLDKLTRKITMECWPRGVDVTQPGAMQYPGWPITVGQLDNFGRKPVAWLPEIEAPAGIKTPVVQVVDERSGEVVYTLRAKTPRFKPWVFAEGSYTVKIGEPPARMKILKAQRSAKP
jgi:hypothetical protein